MDDADAFNFSKSTLTAGKKVHFLAFYFDLAITISLCDWSGGITVIHLLSAALGHCSLAGVGGLQHHGFN